MQNGVSAALRDLVARPIAHRGLHGCGAVGPIENTIAAARAAVTRGYGIECDVQLSADGEPFVFHDDRLDRLLGIAAAIRDLPAAEVDAFVLADGSAIPRLSALLTAVAGATPIFIEIKSRGDGDSRPADAVLQATQGYAGGLAIESFDPRIVERCAGAVCPVGLIGPSEMDGTQPPRCDFLSWNIDRLGSLPQVGGDLPVTTWTVRTRAQVGIAHARGAQIVFEGFRP